MEMRAMPLPLPDPPLHITIESHSDHHMGVFPPPPGKQPSNFGEIILEARLSQRLSPRLRMKIELARLQQALVMSGRLRCSCGKTNNIS